MGKMESYSRIRYYQLGVWLGMILAVSLLSPTDLPAADGDPLPEGGTVIGLSVKIETPSITTERKIAIDEKIYPDSTQKPGEERRYERIVMAQADNIILSVSLRVWKIQGLSHYSSKISEDRKSVHITYGTRTDEKGMALVAIIQGSILLVEEQPSSEPQTSILLAPMKITREGNYVLSLCDDLLEILFAQPNDEKLTYSLRDSEGSIIADFPQERLEDNKPSAVLLYQGINYYLLIHMARRAVYLRAEAVL